MASKKARAAAARRGWETRRRNAAYAKRSAAAKKGWAKRRRRKEGGGGVKPEPKGSAVEFKLAYEVGRRSRHAHLNIRLRKVKGGPITLTEAREAVKRFRDRGSLLAGWEAVAVSWKSGKSTRWSGARRGQTNAAINDLRAVIAGAQLDLSPGLVGEG
jgi:hypothetical protein